VRIGLGYISGGVEAEMKALVAERDRGGPYEAIADLASRSGVGREGLERLAWAGALDELAPGGRREALWRLGVATGARAIPAGTQLSLPLDPPEAPALPELGRWQRLLADYRSTGMTLGDHPLELLRGELGPEVILGAELPHIRPGRTVEVAGLVVARQRPATAKGVVFMLLEDESGNINLILPPPVFERYRAVARTAPLLRARGRLERRGQVINLVVSSLAPLERPDLPLAEVRHIEPPVRTETGKDVDPALVDLRPVAPAAHSFGRRGR
jgi:error-prone DNA polymerase